MFRVQIRGQTVERQGQSPRGASRPLAAVTNDIAPTKQSDTSIVTALRGRLTAKDTQTAELKAALRERDHTIAALHGQLHKLHDA